MDNLFWVEEVVRQYFELNSLKKALEITHKEKKLYELSKTLINVERSIKHGKSVGDI